jgi:hypothetical protein
MLSRQKILSNCNINPRKCGVIYNNSSITHSRNDPCIQTAKYKTVNSKQRLRSILHQRKHYSYLRHGTSDEYQK